MMRKILITMLICMGLSACSPADEGAPTVVLGAGTFIEMLYINPLPDSDALAVNVDELDTSAFSFSVRGAENDQVSGQGYFSQDFSVGIYLNLSTELPNNTVDKAVTIALPNNIEVGSYRIFPFRQVFNLTQEIVGVGGTFITQPPADYDFPFYSYDNVTEGVLTLTEIEPMTGAFRFSAEDHTGKSVTVQGTFNQLEQSFPDF